MSQVHALLDAALGGLLVQLPLQLRVRLGGRELGGLVALRLGSTRVQNG